MANELLTIREIRKTDIKYIYEKLVNNSHLTDQELLALLKLAVVFINENDIDTKKLGYRIFLIYANRYKDYRPLFDISINEGFFPISKYIESTIYANNGRESFINSITSAYLENFRKDKVYLTLQQSNLYTFLEVNKESTISIVAPTSYGKSEVIVDTFKNNPNSNICVIVPSKALLEQTKNRLLNAKIKEKLKIVTYPEMYKESDENIFAVLTQERLLRLLKRNKDLSFDIVFIDEAHNILNNDDRNMLLASTIIILNKRNNYTKLRFLSPFLMDSNNLKLAYTNYQVQEYKVTEYIKSEKLYLVDFRKGKEKNLRLYDQFLDQFLELDNYKYLNEIDFITKNSLSKNIIYFNRPIDIENFTNELINILPAVNFPKIDKVCEELKKHLHREYYLIDAIKHGVIYHHGSIPIYIRLYIEYLFKNESFIKYVITSSTLLEGVNIPAETLFILNNKKGRGNLKPSHLRNLIGRVSRFSEVFSSDTKDLELLEPKIYLVGCKYYQSNANIENFVRKSMKIDTIIEDDTENTLLENTLIDDKNSKDRLKAESFIGNFEPDIINNSNIKIAETEIGKLCFENNVVEIDILQKEQAMNLVVQDYKSRLIMIDSSNSILKAISDTFVDFLKDDKNNNLKRLQNEKARLFYAKFLDWKVESKSYNEMINSFLYYWKYLEDNNKETLVYVDSKWGEETRGGYVPLWVDIKNKNFKQRVNLAIVRINDEQEFLDNVLFKFIDILYELEIIEKTFYYKIKYGTDDLRKIILMKNGVSYSLCHLLIDNYLQYIEINIENEFFNISSQIIDTMQYNDENEIMMFEVKQHVQS
ncbi:DEAD/DEAH box helicase [Aliarcobacter butzleri]|uniref:DEAD/DEAH box helicase family protein n=1 Tax=Aliarcobacter butzleri TaxID=28197 RepID=UPI001EDB0FEC|nr:DEAD/DEAH box helicase family protein [Aliarcobacter butzleri]MCG3668556.1 DEAD/DEAH box helicase [Aliarcobacter butzleri]